jgi:hypothetical protein
MALMFSRVAKNFVKAGYFPTDDATLATILSRIETPDANKLSGVAGDVLNPFRILDPCCGEGAALVVLAEHLQMQGAVVHAYGIEFDRERAWHAKAQSRMTQVAHADVNDVVVGSRSVGCLFLNPPYGDLLSDRAETGDNMRFKAGRARLEKMFFDRTMGSLQFGGLLVLIVPFHVLDEDFAVKIARNFDDVTWYLAPEQQYKQSVVMGRRVKTRTAPKSLVSQLIAFGQGITPVAFDEIEREIYPVPVATQEFRMQVVRIDETQLHDELAKLAGKTLWDQFATQFGVMQQVRRRWLCEPSEWHLALALAAGQVYGSIQGKDGRVLLIKGDTIKEKDCVTERAVDDKGNVSEKRIMTDKFVPIITGLDFTPDRDTFGAVVTVR